MAKPQWRKDLRKNFNEFCKYINRKLVLPAVYHCAAVRPVDKKLVVFADLWDRDMPDNFQSMYAMCQANGYRCAVVSGREYLREETKWRLFWKKRRYEFRFMCLYARCGVLFLVEHYPLADTVKARRDTQVVQLWHGCGIMKKWGWAAVNTGWNVSRKSLRRYPTYINQTLSTVSSASDAVRDGYRDAFNCDPAIIQPLGSPMTDVFFDEQFKRQAVERVHALFPEIGDRKIILYAPTFRGKSIPKAKFQANLDFKALAQALSDQYVIVGKYHPQIKHGGLPPSDMIRCKGFLFDGTQLLSSAEAVVAADILVTDYSSILFEFLLMERPIISYIFDIDLYVRDRGLFQPYDQLAPGPYTFTQEELLDKLLTVDEWFDRERVRQYKQEYMSACDGHSTERIFRTVFGPPADGAES